MFVKAAIGLPVRPAYTLADMAADGIGLLDHLGIDRAHVDGVSMGGMISQHIAARYPQRILSLTSVMSTTGNRRLPRARWLPNVAGYFQTARPGCARCRGSATIPRRRSRRSPSGARR